MKAFTAYFSKPIERRTETGETKVLYYYRIPSLKGEDLAQYKADKGQYFVENEKGEALFSTEINKGAEIEIMRSMKPNPKTGMHSWYAKRTMKAILNDLIKVNPEIGATQWGYADLKEEAYRMYNAETLVVEAVPEEQEKGLDEL